MPIAFCLYLSVLGKQKRLFNVGFYSNFDSALHRQVALSGIPNKLTDYTGKTGKMKKCGAVWTNEFSVDKARTDDLAGIYSTNISNDHNLLYRGGKLWQSHENEELATLRASSYSNGEFTFKKKFEAPGRSSSSSNETTRALSCWITVCNRHSPTR